VQRAALLGAARMATPGEASKPEAPPKTSPAKVATKAAAKPIGQKRERALSSGQLSWLAEKVPRVVKSGNDERDALAERDRCCFQSVIDSCLNDPGNIAAAYAAIEKRKKAASSNILTDDHNARFDKLTQIDRVPTNWLMQFISQHSDLSMGDLLKVYSANATSIVEIFGHITELPTALRLPKQCQVKWVLYEVCKNRVAEVGARGAKFKAKGALTDSGLVDWKTHGVYQLEFDKGRATHVTHMPTKARVAVPEGIVITTQFIMKDNHSDSMASLECPPIPSFKLMRFFTEAAAPSAAGEAMPFSYQVLCGGHNKKSTIWHRTSSSCGRRTSPRRTSVPTPR
jgi:hypothetical protein